MPAWIELWMPRSAGSFKGKIAELALSGKVGFKKFYLYAKDRIYLLPIVRKKPYGFGGK